MPQLKQKQKYLQNEIITIMTTRLTILFDNDYHLNIHSICRGRSIMNALFPIFNKNNTPALPMLHSHNLFAMGREIRILHEGEEYRLRLTRNNRLILTK